MSATKNFIEEKIGEYAEKYSVKENDLMDTFNIMNILGISFGFNDMEEKLMRCYHLFKYIQIDENDR